MSHKSPLDKLPLGRIKDVAVESLKVPASVAGSAVGIAQRATGRAAEAVTSRVGRHGQHPADPASEEKSEKKLDISPDEPINVTEELGLDPAPVEQPKAPTPPPSTPVTGIDAQADPADVDVTPADVAEAVAKPTPGSTVEE